MDECPLERAMRVIGGKWKAPILCALHQDGTTRYNDLKRKIRGVTAAMLANSLKELEDAGLVTRKQFMEMPVRVEYSLTEKSNDLLPILTAIVRWSTNNR